MQLQPTRGAMNHRRAVLETCHGISRLGGMYDSTIRADGDYFVLAGFVVITVPCQNWDARTLLMALQKKGKGKTATGRLLPRLPLGLLPVNCKYSARVTHSGCRKASASSPVQRFPPLSTSWSGRTGDCSVIGRSAVSIIRRTELPVHHYRQPERTCRQHLWLACVRNWGIRGSSPNLVETNATKNIIAESIEVQPATLCRTTIHRMAGQQACRSEILLPARDVGAYRSPPPPERTPITSSTMYVPAFAILPPCPTRRFLVQPEGAASKRDGYGGGHLQRIWGPNEAFDPIWS